MTYLHLLLISCSGSSSDSAPTVSLENSAAKQGSWSENELHRMEQQVDNSLPLQLINDIEDTVGRIESEVLSEWKKSWREGKVEFYKSLLTDTAGLDWQTICEKTRTIGSIEVSECLPTSTPNDTSKEYLASFRK